MQPSDNPRVSIIVAHDEAGLIGRENDLPWKLPADLQRFKRLTMGHSLIMGRKTFESIGRPLPGRTTIVLSRQPQEPQNPPLVQQSAGALLWVQSPQEALEVALQQPGGDEVFIAGGAEIYRLWLQKADRLYLTRVQERFEGDTRFPEVDWSDWQVSVREDYPADERNPHAYSFVTYERLATAD